MSACSDGAVLVRVGREAMISLGAAIALACSSAARADDGPVTFGLNAIGIGVSGRTDLAIGMLEARAVLSPHVAMTAAPTILTIEGGDSEHQLRVATTFSMPVGPLHIDDRNMWVFSDAGTTRYRNRLRFTAPVEVYEHTFRLQLLDEVTHEQGGRGWFRNMYGVGLGLDVARSFAVDAYLARQDDRHRPTTTIFFVVLVAHLM